uniref:Uncharacterized protein n=1 Tax=Mola mola TaxID=94237 RepID=A0A3Q4AC15_MOLML
MNPTHYPVQPAQVQGREGLPGAAPVQYTTVNIPAEPPKDHIIWSLCCFVYSNPCCLGLAALIFSIKARDRKVLGDLNGAQVYASTARCLNIWSTALVFCIILLSIIVTIITSAQASQAIRRYNNYQSG